MPSDGAIEIRGAASALLDEPFLLRVRGAGPDEEILWRARIRDDDGRVWRSAAARAAGLASSWRPSKPTTGPLAALQSLRPVTVEVRAEAADGRAASRTLTRRLVADGVRLRRWRDGPVATLHLPAADAPSATLLIDATAGGPEQAATAVLAAPLLASRGVLVLALVGARDETPEHALEAARELLAAVPAAGASELQVLAADAVGLPPGVPSRGGGDRGQAWDALLAHLEARPRETQGD